MSLEELKDKIINWFDIEPSKIQIKDNGKTKKLRIQFVLNCYYDEINENYYGETKHWWLNSSRRTLFYYPKNQINALLKRLSKLNNCMKIKENK